MSVSDVTAAIEAVLDAAIRNVRDERKMSAQDLLELMDYLRSEACKYKEGSEERLVLLLAATGGQVLVARMIEQDEQKTKGGRIR